MTKAEVRSLQRELNNFTNKYLNRITPLIVDGVNGHATKKRIRMAKWYLGYARHRLNKKSNHEFRVRLRHPRSVKYAEKFVGKEYGKRAVRRGKRRRQRQRRRSRVSHFKSYLKPGVTRYDGRAVAKAAVPILNWARAHGWKGYVVSGWRDPKYSQQLCYSMCGRPFCSGRCAGLASNHVGSSPARFALDVSDYAKFAQLMRSCPVKPRIYNRLGWRDPVHFSPSGN